MSACSKYSKNCLKWSLKCQQYFVRSCLFHSDAYCFTFIPFDQIKLVFQRMHDHFEIYTIMSVMLAVFIQCSF